MNLKTKFLAGAFSLSALTVLSVGGMTLYAERAALQKELINHHNQLAAQLAKVCEEALYQNNEILFFNYLKALRQETGFREAGMVNDKSVFLLHSNPQMIGKSPPARASNDVSVISADVLHSGQSVGQAGISFSNEEVAAYLQQSFHQTLRKVGVISLIAVAIGLLGAVWLAQTMARPIQDIVSGMRRVASGKLEPLIFRPRRDELGWLGIELNSTIRKLKELDDMKREFVSGVTHELRSPLTAIDRFIALLRKGAYGPLTVQQADCLVTVQNNTTRLTRFIDDLLSTAKIESRRVDLYLEKFDVREPLMEVVKLYTPLAMEKKIRFNTQFPDRPAFAMADREKVIQIVTNLLSNAFKFTEKGAVTLEIRDQPKMVSVAVGDSGVGIAPEERASVFDKFFRSESTAHKVKGTGLGLAIVKGLVEALQGTIGVTENPGGGSRFVFTLPKERA